MKKLLRDYMELNNKRVTLLGKISATRARIVDCRLGNRTGLEDLEQDLVKFLAEEQGLGNRMAYLYGLAVAAACAPEPLKPSRPPRKRPGHPQPQLPLG